jgi:hypothetical protein
MTGKMNSVNILNLYLFLTSYIFNAIFDEQDVDLPSQTFTPRSETGNKCIECGQISPQQWKINNCVMRVACEGLES